MKKLQPITSIIQLSHSLSYSPTTFESQSNLHNWKNRMVVDEDDGINDIHFSFVVNAMIAAHQSFLIILQCELLKILFCLITNFVFVEILHYSDLTFHFHESSWKRLWNSLRFNYEFYGPDVKYFTDVTRLDFSLLCIP